MFVKRRPWKARTSFLRRTWTGGVQGAGPGDTEADRRPLQEVNSIPILKRMNRIMDILVTEVKRLKEQVYNSNVNNLNVNNLRF